MKPTVGLGIEVQTECGWRRGLSSLMVDHRGSFMYAMLQRLSCVPEAVRYHWRFMSREIACE